MGLDVRNWEKQESSSVWEPAKGEELIGELIGSEDGKFGTQYIIKRESDGESVKMGTWKVLISRMAGAKIGDIVKIVFVGEELPTVRGNKPTKIFEVFIHKA